MKAAEAVGRNPDASGAILVQSIIGMALAEAVAFYSLFSLRGILDSSTSYDRFSQSWRYGTGYR